MGGNKLEQYIRSPDVGSLIAFNNGKWQPIFSLLLPPARKKGHENHT